MSSAQTLELNAEGDSVRTGSLLKEGAELRPGAEGRRVANEDPGVWL